MNGQEMKLKKNENNGGYEKKRGTVLSECF